jgi:hypothetical protein
VSWSEKRESTKRRGVDEDGDDDEVDIKRRKKVR